MRVNIKARVKKLLSYLLRPQKFFGLIYASYLTLRYVDSYAHFPAFNFKKRIIRIIINKRKGSQFTTKGILQIQPWIGTFPTEISIGEDAALYIHNDFILGDDVHIKLSKNSKCEILGKMTSSGSGITARSILLIDREAFIGSDVIIAWDTFITDSDWHSIGDNPRASRVHIGNHVWVANGVKILKGTVIGDDCIVGCGSVVTGGIFPNRTLICGIPAKVAKNRIESWTR